MTILPTPMHTVNRAKHSREPSSLVLLQNPSRVFGIGGSQVYGAKHAHNCDDKALNGLILTHCQVVINKIRRYYHMPSYARQWSSSGRFYAQAPWQHSSFA